MFYFRFYNPNRRKKQLATWEKKTATDFLHFINDDENPI